MPDPDRPPPPADQQPLTRGALLRRGGAGGALALAGAALVACGSSEGTSGETGGSGEDERASEGSDVDIDVANFALGLEVVENEFYRQIVDSGQVKTKRASEFVKKVAANEGAHLDALRKVVDELGGEPATPPREDFAAVLAEGEDYILRVASLVENLGAAAYLGQVGRIRDKELLAAALSIHTVEARHAATFNTLAEIGFRSGEPLEGRLPDGPFAKPMAMGEALSSLRGLLEVAA